MPHPFFTPANGFSYHGAMLSSPANSFAGLSLPPEVRLLGTLHARTPGKALADADIREALAHPLWPEGRSQSAWDAVAPGDSVCIVVSDQTRRTAADRVLPILVDGWLARGCAPADLSILVATGIHRAPTDAEVEHIIGRRMADRFAGRIHRHDPDAADGLVSVGRTPRGHAVRVNRRVIETDRLILTGSATYHYHAGFGGGRKSLVPGVAARETIAYNHSLTLDPEVDRIRAGVDVGRLDGNPVAEEMLAGARLCNPDLIVNTVLAPDGSLAGVYAGELETAHRAACRQVEALYRVDLAERADLVIASAAGAPNWIQSHKALFNASRAVTPHGRIVLLAPCPEGLGNERFRYWIRKRDPKQLFAELRRCSEVNGQTAISTLRRGRQCILITAMQAGDVSDLGMITAPDLPTAVAQAVAEVRQHTPNPTAFLMPDARYVVPF